MVKQNASDGLDGDLETVMRRWPHLPEHIRKALVELVSHYGPPPVNGRFPTPPGADWRHVQIVLLSPTEAHISVGSVAQRYTFTALGLADRRTRKRPRGEWRMLQTYAENPEPDAYYKLPSRDYLKVEISKFRRWLQTFFGIPGDPLKPFKTGLWLPKFKVRAEY
jgi:hypothetical protein